MSKLTFTLTLCVAVALACVAYPVYVIRPFRAQGAGELAAALAVMRVRGALTAVCALAAIAALVVYWRAEVRWRRRIVAATAAVGTCVLAGLARVNIYELMFHPIGGAATFSTAKQVEARGRRKGDRGEGRRERAGVSDPEHLVPSRRQ